MVGGGGGWYEVTTRDKVSKMTLPIMSEAGSNKYSCAQARVSLPEDWLEPVKL